jgi:hypothetical protein
MDASNRASRMSASKVRTDHLRRSAERIYVGVYSVGGPRRQPTAWCSTIFCHFYGRKHSTSPIVAGFADSFATLFNTVEDDLA